MGCAQPTARAPVTLSILHQRGQVDKIILISLTHLKLSLIMGWVTLFKERGKAFKSSAQTQGSMQASFTKAGLNISLVVLQFLEESLHEGDARAPRATKITIIHCAPLTDMKSKNSQQVTCMRDRSWFSVWKDVTVCCNQSLGGFPCANRWGAGGQSTSHPLLQRLICIKPCNQTTWLLIQFHLKRTLKTGKDEKHGVYYYYCLPGYNFLF